MLKITKATELSNDDMNWLAGTDLLIKLVNSKVEVRFSLGKSKCWEDILEWLRENANHRWYQSPFHSPYTVVNENSLLYGWLYFEEESDATAFKLKWS